MIRLARGATLLGSLLGMVILVWVAAQQINLAGILRGEIPWNIALRMGSNALPFIVFMMLVMIVVAVTAVKQNIAPLWAGLIWLGVSLVLAYAVYLSRFSIGPLLIPSAVIIFLSGVLTIFRSQSN